MTERPVKHGGVRGGPEWVSLQTESSQGVHHAPLLPAEPDPDLAQGIAGLTGGDDLAEDAELLVVEQQIAALGASGGANQLLAEIEIEVRASQTCRRAKIAGHVEPRERRQRARSGI